MNTTLFCASYQEAAGVESFIELLSASVPTDMIGRMFRLEDGISSMISHQSNRRQSKQSIKEFKRGVRPLCMPVHNAAQGNNADHFGHSRKTERMAAATHVTSSLFALCIGLSET